MGSVGLINDEDNKTIDNKTITDESKLIVLSAIKWLNNKYFLYKKYLCNYEKIIYYLISLSPDSLLMGSLIIAKDYFNTLEVLNSDGKFASSGLY